MGWATGSGIAEKIWSKIKPKLDKEQQKFVSKILYNTFCDYDADDWEWEKGMLEYDAYKLNKPKEWKEINKQYEDEE